MGTITFDSVSKSYEGDIVAVKDLDLEVKDGEFLTLVGPSGSGKSTTLRMLAGLESVTEGEIRLAGEVVNYLPPRKRDVAMVFQNYALYPHLNVYENMAFGLKRSTDLSKEEIKKRVNEAAEMMDIKELLDDRPKQLSGGQKQRVATGRAIVREPEVFLFDEPLSNLDAKLRKHMRTELNRIQQDLETTTIYVTHDQEEAMTMSDRIAILHQGVLQQVGTPTEVYQEPNNLFVGQFIGSPSMNIFDVVYDPKDDTLTGDFEYQFSQEVATKLEDHGGTHYTLGVRPEDLQLAEIGDDQNTFEVVVELIEPLGRDNLMYFDLPEADTEGREYVTFVDPNYHPDVGEHVYLTFDDQQIHLFEEESGLNVLKEDPPARVERIAADD